LGGRNRGESNVVKIFPGDLGRGSLQVQKTKAARNYGGDNKENEKKRSRVLFLRRNSSLRRGSFGKNLDHAGGRKRGGGHVFEQQQGVHEILGTVVHGGTGEGKRKCHALTSKKLTGTDKRRRSKTGGTQGEVGGRRLLGRYVQGGRKRGKVICGTPIRIQTKKTLNRVRRKTETGVS